MKISKTFRLSEEAVEKLGKQDNATQYLEDLILDTPHERKLEVVSLQQLEALLDEKLKKIVLPEAKDSWVEVGGPPPSNPGKWVWSMELGGEVNTVTGEVREA